MNAITSAAVTGPGGEPLFTRPGHRTSWRRFPTAGKSSRSARTCFCLRAPPCGSVASPATPSIHAQPTSRFPCACERAAAQLPAPQDRPPSGRDRATEPRSARRSRIWAATRRRTSCAAASTHCEGRASITSFQARTSIWSSSLGGAGRPLPGTIGTIERSASERLGMTWKSLPPLAPNTKNSTPNSLKGLMSSNYVQLSAR
jgi:hypothetical protein